MGELKGIEPAVLQPVVLEAVRYDTQSGLVPVVVQDVETGLVLMQAYANREALKRTIGTGQAWFWSRSREEYWHKGATSGNVMNVREIRLDCDGDSVLYLVSPQGPACHTGSTTCYFRTIAPKEQAGQVGEVGETGGGGGAAGGSQGGADAVGQGGSDATEQGGSVGQGGLTSRPAPIESESRGHASTAEIISSDVVEISKGPKEASPEDESILETLWAVLESRYRERPQGSYTTYLFEHGVDKIAKKVGEEAVEVVIAAKNAMAMAQASGTSGASTGSAVSTDGTPDDSGLNAGQKELASESADLLYHLLALWKQAGVTPNHIYKVLRERHG